MHKYNQKIGKLGEKLAGNFLKSRGYRILNRNYRTPFGEIDLIVSQKNILIFVEVKTKTSESYSSPFSAITAYKKKTIIKNCKYYLKKHKLTANACRIDVIGITLDNKNNLQILRHIKTAIHDNI